MLNSRDQAGVFYNAAKDRKEEEVLNGLKKLEALY
jgi:hypothetical protein